MGTKFISWERILFSFLATIYISLEHILFHGNEIYYARSNFVSWEQMLFRGDEFLFRGDEFIKHISNLCPIYISHRKKAILFPKLQILAFYLDK